MRKFVACALAALTLAGCADSKVINGHRYQPYGLANADEKRRPEVEYRIVVGNLVWAVLLSETIVAPIAIACWFLYEPVGPAT